MADWQISKPLGQCYGTNQPFEVGQEYYAALVETDEGLERRDFSCAYWQEAKPPVYCFWKSRMPEEGGKKRLLVDDEMLMAFFDRLAEETETEKVQFRFVLTLILMRKRRLKYDASRTDEQGREIWTLGVTGQDRQVEVVNPHLTEDQIEQLSGQVGQILQVDL